MTCVCLCFGPKYSVAGDYKSTKEQLQNSFKIRACFNRALELNPSDATTAHLIGMWLVMGHDECLERGLTGSWSRCAYFASMSYATRAVASLLFASPPSSTHEEALRYLLLAGACCGVFLWPCCVASMDTCVLRLVIDRKPRAGFLQDQRVGDRQAVSSAG